MRYKFEFIHIGILPESEKERWYAFSSRLKSDYEYMQHPKNRPGPADYWSIELDAEELTMLKLKFPLLKEYNEDNHVGR